MENFTEASNAMIEMGESEGALSEANDIYMDSVQAHIQQLKNAFTEFSQSAIAADAIKDFTDFAKDALKIASAILKVINAIGGLRTVIPLVSSLFVIFKGQTIIASLRKMSESFINFVSVAKKSFETARQSAANFGKSMTSTAKTTASAAEMINSALGVIGIAATLASAIVSLIQNIIDGANEQTQSLIDAGEASGAKIDSIETAYNNYAELVNSGSASTDELSSSLDTLAKSLGISRGELDAVTDSAASYDAALQDLIIQQEQLNLLEEKKGIEAAKGKIDAGMLDNMTRTMNQVAMDLGVDWYSPGADNERNYFFKNVLGIDPDEIKESADWIPYLDQIGKKVIELKNSSKYGENSRYYKAAFQFYENLRYNFRELIPLMESYSKHQQTINQHIAQASLHKSTEDVQEFKKTVKELGSDSNNVGKVTNAFNDLRKRLIETTMANEAFSGSEEDAKVAVDKILSATPEFAEFYTVAEKAALGTSAFARGLQGIKDVAEGTAEAVSALDETLKSDDYDTGMEKRVEYYKKLQEEVEQNNWGGKHYKALADYFNIDVTQSVDEQIAQIQKLSQYYSDTESGLVSFLMNVADNANTTYETVDENGNKVIRTLSEIATFDTETGTLWWDSAELEHFADALGISRDMLIDFLGAYREHVPPAEWFELTPKELASWLEQDHIIKDVNGDLAVNKEMLSSLAESAGKDFDDVIATLEDYYRSMGKLGEGENLIIISAEIDLKGLESAEEGANRIKEYLYSVEAAGKSADEQIATIAASLSQLSAEEAQNILIELDFPENTTEKILSYLPEDMRAEINIDNEEANNAIEDITVDLEDLGIQIDGIDGSTITITITDNGSIANFESRLQGVINRANSNGLTVTSAGNSGGGYVKAQGGRIMERATGTRNASPGLTLLGDEYSASGRPKPELVVSDDRAFLAGVNGPVVRKLNAGDVVYTYQQTKRILGNNLNQDIGIPALSGGTPNRWWNSVSSGGSTSSYANTATYSNYYGNSSGWSGSSASTSSIEDAESWFEQQYELHNHYRKLDKETDAAYLTWLTSAWKQAYAEGVIDVKEAHKYEEESYELMKKIASERFMEEYNQHQHMVALGKETDQEYYSWLEWRYKTAYANNEITLEEYWKYEEEVYKKSKELVSDYFNDIDKKIDMLENAGKSNQEIIKWDESGMKYVEEQIAKLKKEGKDNNDSTVQELQSTWWSYYNDRKRREEDVTKNAKDAAKELVDYRIKMLKKDLDAEKNSLNTKLKNLQDFYSKQKELLSDAYDEDKYLDEQAEKRKAVSDIEIQLAQLEFDTSAWAQKRRLELSQQLVDAQKELADFEKDHALKVAQDRLDELQKLQEQELENEIDAIDKATSDEAALYEQALKDIQRADKSLYDEMVDYNNTEGTGNPEDIAEMWDGAYTSLKKYKEMYGEYYKDIRMGYGTDITPAPVDTSKIDAGLNPVQPKLVPEAPKKAATPAPAPAPKPAPAPVKSTPVTGSAVRLKSNAKLAYTSYDNPTLTPASWVMGKTLYVQAMYPGRAAPYHIGTTPGGYYDSSTWVGFVNLSQLEGYARGTRSASSGLHEINERGDEALFKTSDGSTYRLFSGGEKVFKHSATDFLYDFANNPVKILSSILERIGNGIGSEIKNNVIAPNISMGDVIIQGSASDKTISEIRREKRSEIDYMLKELTRLNK